MEKQQHIGTWITQDGDIRHEFLPNGRYTETRGDSTNAFTGYYSILGSHVEYLDDTGFTANGDFSNGAFYYAGKVFYKDNDELDNDTEQSGFENKKPAY